MLAGSAPPDPWVGMPPDAARRFAAQRQALRHKHLAAYQARNLKDVLRQCDQYGVDHRTPLNLTPLMAAAIVGNVALVEALLDRGADPELTDHFGRSALHWALLEAFSDARYAAHSLPALWERIAPAAIDVMVGGGARASDGKVGRGQAGDGTEAGGGAEAGGSIGTRGGHGRLIRIDRHLGEYFLFQAMFALCKSLYTAPGSGPLGFDTATLLAALEPIPATVLKPERKRRQYLSHVLSRNETTRDYAYNRHLFRRLRHGWYQFDPLLRMRYATREGGVWRPIYEVLNLALVAETAPEYRRGFLRGLIAMAEGDAEPISDDRSMIDGG